MNHVYWQTIGAFTNVIDNIMNHVYWQTRVVFTNVIDNSHEPCFLSNNRDIYPMSLIIL